MYKRFFLILLFFNFSSQQARVIGIANFTNNCFMNASLQCLLKMDDLNKFLINHSSLYKDNLIVSTYISIYNFYSYTESNLFNPGNFIDNIRFFLWERVGLGLTQQGDAQEFLNEILEKVSDIKDVNLFNQIKRLYKITYKSGLLADPFRITKDSDVNYTELHNILALPITRDTLKENLNDFFMNLEYIKEFSGSKKYKFTKLGFLPEYFIIQLKRFEIDRNMCGVKKVFKKVEFPFYGLNLNPYLLNDSDRANYDLNGIIYHLGVNPKEGHYIAAVKDGDQWFLCDDSNVRPIENIEKEHIDGEPYIFFYKKRKFGGGK